MRGAKILIADDHAVVRRGVEKILADSSNELQVAGEAENSEQLLEMIHEQRWDLVVLDLAMPGMGGLDLLKEIKHLRPELPVLILTMHDARQYAVRMIKAGASGFVNKENVSEVLVRAIQEVLEGRRYMDRAAADALVDHLSGETDTQPHETLSDREFQVVKAIAEGQRIKDIAANLNLSPRTISTYRRRALEKLNCETDADLVRYVLEAGLSKKTP